VNNPLDHKGLIIKIANQYRVTAGYYSSVDIQDLIQEAWVAVIRCIDNFNPDLGFKISAYLTRCIHTAITDYLRGRSVFRRAKKWSGLKLGDYMLHSEEFDCNKSKVVNHGPEAELEGQQEVYRKIKDYTNMVERKWYSKELKHFCRKTDKYVDFKAYLCEAEPC